jgi:hypothetical protein
LENFSLLDSLGITEKIKATNKEEHLIQNTYLKHMEKMDSFRLGESIIPPVNCYLKSRKTLNPYTLSESKTPKM